MPIATGEAHGPGTKLREGWVVPKGAVLAGPVLPLSYDPVPTPLRWRALLAIDGDVATPMRDLAAQAGRLYWRGGTTCSAGPTYGCGGFFDDRHARTLSVYLQIDHQISVLLLDFESGIGAAPCTERMRCTDVVPRPPARPTFAPLPTVGQPVFGVASDRPYHVVDGSVVVATWRLDNRVALIRVDRDAGRVIAAYVEQLRSDATRTSPQPSVVLRTVRAGGWTLRIWSAYTGEHPSFVCSYERSGRRYVEITAA